MNGPKVIFRCDANEMIGGGHMMRCIALAEACSEVGMRPVFATQALSAADHHRLISRGFGHATVPAMEHQALWLAQSRADAVVVDRYGLPSDYLDAWKSTGKRPALHLVDDTKVLAGATHVLNQNLGAEVVHHPHQTLLLGLKYALLRREFRHVEPLPAPKVVQRLVLTMGAADPDGRTMGLLGALEPMVRWYGMRLALVVGPHNQQVASLRRQAASKPWVDLYENVANMADLMSSCQLAVSASGSTLWELFALGVPRVVLSLAQNQVPLAQAAAEHGAAINMGDAADLDPEDLTKACERLIEDQAARQAQADAGRALVDGQGALRVAQALKEAL